MPTGAIARSTSASGSIRIATPDGRTRVTVNANRIVRLEPCSETCCWRPLAKRPVTVVPLGGTRPNAPGLRARNTLTVTNVFTSSQRGPVFVRRTPAAFRAATDILQKLDLPEIVAVQSHCSCATTMEYVEDYIILEHRSAFTPPQHAQSWSDAHTAAEFLSVANQLLRVLQMLHGRGVFHTDVTGFNVLMQGNKPKLVDLFSCVTVDAIGWPWLPKRIRHWLGRYVEFRQIEKYLLEPAALRWNQKFSLDRRRYQVVLH